MRLTPPSPVRPASALRPRSWGFLLLLLAAPLAAQVEGTWTATLPERLVRGVPVTETGTIRFAADGSYTAARKWTWLADGIRTGLYAYIEGTWRTEGNTLCVKREDGATEVCQPYTATDHTLAWGPFTFTGAGE